MCVVIDDLSLWLVPLERSVQLGLHQTQLATGAEERRKCLPEEGDRSFIIRIPLLGDGDDD